MSTGDKYMYLSLRYQLVNKGVDDYFILHFHRQI